MYLAGILRWPVIYLECESKCCASLAQDCRQQPFGAAGFSRKAMTATDVEMMNEEDIKHIEAAAREVHDLAQAH